MPLSLKSWANWRWVQEKRGEDGIRHLCLEHRVFGRDDVLPWGRLKTRDLTNARPYNEGGHGETCFSVRVAAHYNFMFAAWSII